MLAIRQHTEWWRQIVMIDLFIADAAIHYVDHINQACSYIYHLSTIGSP